MWANSVWGAFGLCVTLLLAGVPLTWTTEHVLLGRWLLVGSVLSGTASLITLMWPYLPWHFSRLAAGVITAGIGLIGAGSSSFPFWESGPKDIGDNRQSINPTVFNAQFDELKQLISFIGGKTEHDLINLFDFSNMVKANVSGLNDRIRATAEGHFSSWTWEPFLEPPNRQMIASTKVGRWSMTPGGVHVDAEPNDVHIIKLTQKYQESKNALDKFENSTLMPQSVITPLKELNQTIGKNSETLLEVLDQAMKEDKNYFLQSENYGSKYYGVISTRFFGRFIQLKPKADAVAKAIREYLGTK